MKIAKKELLKVIKEFLIVEAAATLNDVGGYNCYCVTEGKYVYIFFGTNPKQHRGNPLGSYIKLSPPGTHYGGTKGAGNCHGAWHVGHVLAENKLGPLLYDIAMEFSTLHGGGLTCGRDRVSDEAYAIWEYYLNKRVPSGEVEALQQDAKEIPRTPPTEDDCAINSSANAFVRRNNPDISNQEKLLNNFLDNWWFVNDPLSKTYRKKPDLLTKLGDRFINLSGY